MPYRDDLEAARERVRQCEAELERLRARDERATELEAELAETQHQIYRATLPVLSNLRIATPCDASWHDMPGDDRVRHCGACKNTVYNISGMTGAEAEALVRDARRPLCLRFYRRWDGTVMTADCRRRTNALVSQLVVAGAVALGVLILAAFLVEPTSHVMGGMHVHPPTPGEPHEAPPAGMAESDR